MATKGTKWFLRRSVDLIPYMLFMAAREALVEPREWPAVAGPAGAGHRAGGPRSCTAPVSRGSQAAEPVAE